MRFSTFVAALLPVGAALAQSVHNVTVGFNKTLTYMPSSINASVGDIVLFTFESGNHTVTQSSFAAPCANISTPAPIDSGFQPIAATSDTVMLYNFTVTNASAPMWFYCRQTGHCEKGMVFAINAPATGAKTFTAFQAAAEATNTTTTGTSSSSSTSSAATSATTTHANGANAIRFGGAAGVLAVVGVAAGVLL